jgi:tRNA pseudouridine13 synthase
MQPELIYPYGAAQVGARLKSIPEDFEVEEVLGFEPQGEGEHLFLWVEKRGLTTHELVERIARDHGLTGAPIGYSGLKDKHALTRQWLSLQLPGKADPFDCPCGEGYRVLRQARHTKKLRPGSHKFNRFRLCLREVEDLPQRTRQQMDSVVTQGFANYFGAQRFGRKADNVEQALLQLGKRRLSRARKSILLSSLRSHLFNAILALRIEQGHWQAPLDGDVFMLRGSHSIFSEPVDAALLERYRQLDLSPCASLYGAGRSLMSGQAAALEQQVFAAHPEITACLENQRSNLQMRPLRALVESFSYDYDAAAKLLRLELSLPAGGYVTTLLEHFLLLEEPG